MFPVTITRKDQSELSNTFADSLAGPASAESDVPMTGIERARQLFEKAGLIFPAIPDELAWRLEERGEWLFSTRDLKTSPYDLQWFIRELDEPALEQNDRSLAERNAEATPVCDYALVTHSGHGVNSYAMQYYLVYGHVALFLHLSWGGIYMDATECAHQIRDCFVLADAIVRAARREQRLQPGSRLTVVGSDFYGSYWALSGESAVGTLANASGPGSDKGPDRPVEVLTDVLDWLNTLAPNDLPDRSDGG